MKNILVGSLVLGALVGIVAAWTALLMTYPVETLGVSGCIAFLTLAYCIGEEIL